MRIFRNSAVLYLAFVMQASAQMKYDIDAENLRKSMNVVYIQDLSVKDVAYVWAPICIKDKALFIPGWTLPLDLPNYNYELKGVIIRLEMQPGKRLRATYVDAVQAYQIAKGNRQAGKHLDPKEYNEAVRTQINELAVGGLFGNHSCDLEIADNSLRQTVLLPVDSINGFSTVSQLLASLRD